MQRASHISSTLTVSPEKRSYFERDVPTTHETPSTHMAHLSARRSCSLVSTAVPLSAATNVNDGAECYVTAPISSLHESRKGKLSGKKKRIPSVTLPTCRGIAPLLRCFISQAYDRKAAPLYTASGFHRPHKPSINLERIRRPPRTLFTVIRIRLTHKINHGTSRCINSAFAHRLSGIVNALPARPPPSPPRNSPKVYGSLLPIFYFCTRQHRHQII